ncbi:hypothetical protein [Burkholderia lata]|uniref:Uncharacterized protein n=1 Tax=Burkholderia lata (strain ATCC 17760 / DSM 23089 / LMG 22485 / NCIMB 9086 / R18194 / 383) TaxID=482957 RepID=A0A6P2WZU9_BURL3|nr:hypothetical protein [Burkholderia lata]VWD02362.1 hypothetical protein BLA18109_04662 [Burkholderia lata]
MTARFGCLLAFREGRCHRSGVGDATAEPAEPFPVARFAAQATAVKAAA